VFSFSFLAQLSFYRISLSLFSGLWRGPRGQFAYCLLCASSAFCSWLFSFARAGEQWVFLQAELFGIAVFDGRVTRSSSSFRAGPILSFFFLSWPAFRFLKDFSLFLSFYVFTPPFLFSRFDRVFPTMWRFVPARP